MTRFSTVSATRGEHVPTADHRVWLCGVEWDSYKRFLALRGDVTKPRVTYLQGTLELMSPSRDHEEIRRVLVCVIDEYLRRSRTRFAGAGSWLLEDSKSGVAIEPDEAYVLHDLQKAVPDLALEVVWTSGGIGKLDAYRNLGVREVWFWEDDELTFFVLGPDGYEERAQSECIPDFDKHLAQEMLQFEALSDVQDALRARLGT